MAIENRNLMPGMCLVAQYKKQTYFCEVVPGDRGVRYRLEDGREFKIPSAAGSAVMGGQACNGWRFWSLAGATFGAETGQQEQRPTAAVVGKDTRRRTAKVIRRVPNQQGVPDGQVRWFCTACADSFSAPAGATPDACPQGHQAELDGNRDLVTVGTVGQVALGE